jgi:ribosomal protein S18 acetylase RimI-like enzyme
VKIIVREARPHDYAAAGDVAVDAYRSINPDLGRYEARLRDVAGRMTDATVLIAVVDDRLVGTATYVPGPHSQLAETDDPDDAGLRMLAVAPDIGGRGIGTALVEHAVDLARWAGRRRLVLLTRPEMHAAHRIYRRMGFVRVPEIDEVWEDVTLLGYARMLDDTTRSEDLDRTRHDREPD